ncbi:glucosamine-6-phosphate deaminase [Natronogracilivirga saccharolytica]|uniref:Glucosamine-6-phosphate deaminase n=1 Tax=Natronogracilivirga saccharolytica TaxID=2812953 RepID=A0A8J7RQA7_9BACT|nr:glucosamine-6-phosphate deaminase [Natronogracilivirga saccharolytica]MBP3193969.1 glucosamine-6-phosphate deaminase [Natronogracilivirga saccharolytica]
MKIDISDNKIELGEKSALKASEKIRQSIEKNNTANIILATGASQFETLKNLVKSEGIDWSSVNMFHLDEYVGLDMSHPASFRKYLKERFVDKVAPLKSVNFINADNWDDPQKECDRLNQIIKEHPIDVALIGIGENAHLAFNDPPADFDTTDPYIIVELDEACRNQQMNEGWFKNIEDVPRKAISMSINHILLSDEIVCSVPDERKAPAVKNSFEREITNLYPASVLQKHNNCTVFLDRESASLLSDSQP